MHRILAASCAAVLLCCFVHPGRAQDAAEPDPGSLVAIKAKYLLVPAVQGKRAPAFHVYGRTVYPDGAVFHISVGLKGRVLRWAMGLVSSHEFEATVLIPEGLAPAYYDLQASFTPMRQELPHLQRLPATRTQSLVAVGTEKQIEKARLEALSELEEIVKAAQRHYKTLRALYVERVPTRDSFDLKEWERATGPWMRELQKVIESLRERGTKFLSPIYITLEGNVQRYVEYLEHVHNSFTMDLLRDPTERRAMAHMGGATNILDGIDMVIEKDGQMIFMSIQLKRDMGDDAWLLGQMRQTFQIFRTVLAVRNGSVPLEGGVGAWDTFAEVRNTEIDTLAGELAKLSGAALEVTFPEIVGEIFQLPDQLRNVLLECRMVLDGKGNDLRDAERMFLSNFNRVVSGLGFRTVIDIPTPDREPDAQVEMTPELEEKVRGWIGALAVADEAQTLELGIRLSSLGRPVLPLLAQGMDHKDANVVRACVRILPMIRADDAVVPALVEKFAKTPGREKDLRLLIIEAIGITATEDAGRFLQEELRKKPDRETKLACIEGIRKVRELWLVPTLVDCLEDSDKDVRREAAIMLELITGISLSKAGWDPASPPAEGKAFFAAVLKWYEAHKPPDAPPSEEPPR